MILFVKNGTLDRDRDVLLSTRMEGGMNEMDCAVVVPRVIITLVIPRSMEVILHCHCLKMQNGCAYLSYYLRKSLDGREFENQANQNDMQVSKRVYLKEEVHDE
jgi:hypothetical protein